MVKFVALYRRPADAEAFDENYFSTHAPLIDAVPGLVRQEVARVDRMLAGDGDFYLLAELYFETRDDLRAAVRTPEWAATGENLRSWGGMDLVTMFTATVVGADGQPA
jgi:uncharacterized protein (TIGR02118 family)